MDWEMGERISKNVDRAPIKDRERDQNRMKKKA